MERRRRTWMMRRMLYCEKSCRVSMGVHAVDGVRGGRDLSHMMGGHQVQRWWWWRRLRIPTWSWWLRW